MSVLTLRPSADVSGIQTAGGASGQGGTWDPYVASAYNGGGNGWATVDDAVSQPTVPDLTDYLFYSQAGPLTAILDLSTGTIPGGETVTSATVWAYFSNANNTSAQLTVKLTRADNSVLASTGVVTTSTSGLWISATYTGALSQAEVDGLRIALTSANTFSGDTVYATYAEVVSSTPAAGRQVGTATFSRALRADGKIVETITGNGTWFAPPGVFSVDVAAWGGGGASGSSSLALGGGGGGGAYAGATVAVNPSVSVSVVRGSAGLSAATPGGDTSFGTAVIAKGGGAGVSSAIGNGAGGAGGTAAASTGTVKFSGGAGATGGGGGGSAGASGNGGAASGNTGGTAGAGGGAAGGAGGTNPGSSGGAPGAGGGSPAVLTAIGPGGPSMLTVAYTEVGPQTSSIFPQSMETLAEQQTNASAVTLVDEDALADMGSQPVVATIAGDGALLETQLQLLISTFLGSMEALADTASLTSSVVPTAVESLAQAQVLTSVLSVAALEVLAQTDALTSTATYTGAGALLESQLQLLISTFLGSAEALADTQTVAVAATIAGNAALAETQLLAAVLTVTGREALAETAVLSALATLTQSEATADHGDVPAVLTTSANWKLISSGLSGVAYDIAGVETIPGAEVIVFDNVDDTVFARLTTDAVGSWFTQANPNDLYWITYWKGSLPDRTGNVFARTDRAIAPTDTVIATGT
jgi:hypothetical protein